MSREMGAVAVRRAIAKCTRCSLRLEATAPVPWSGPLSPDIAVLGEAPGRTEDREGKPFVGPAGHLLRAVLDKAGINSKLVTWLNSACCYPKVTKTPTTEHLSKCRVHLVGQLAAIQPKHLLIVGTTALSAILGNYVELKQVRGRPLYVARLEPFGPFSSPIVGWSTYHPAAALRSPTYRFKLEDDVQTFSSWMKNGDIFPGTCVKCGDVVESWDDYGLAWCGKHSGRQMQLL